ncbi:MAG: arylesterase [Verrucomicrobiales bacterium]|nr:arylesterase [Verrucomicrobiales bacterium]
MRCVAWRMAIWLLWLVPSWTGGLVGAEVSVEATVGRRTLVVLGDSLAAGYGVDPGEAYPSVLQRWIEREKLPFEVVNAGVSGDTTAGGLRRMNWLLRRPMDVLLVALGGNDGLRGISPEATRTNLVRIVEVARTKQPGIRVVVAGMQMPPNMGPEYTRQFQEVFPAVSRETKSELVPHLLEGVGGRPEMNQPDLIHPTPAGHQVLASNVWAVLKPVLESAAASR